MESRDKEDELLRDKTRDVISGYAEGLLLDVAYWAMKNDPLTVEAGNEAGAPPLPVASDFPAGRVQFPLPLVGHPAEYASCAPA